MRSILTVLSLCACTTDVQVVTNDQTGPAVDHPTLGDLDFFQAVRVPVLADGIEIASSERVAPLVVGRDAVLRARLDVPAGWSGGDVELAMDVVADGYSDTLWVSGSPEQDLVLAIPASAMGEHTTFVVRVEAAGVELHRFPSQGEADLDAVVTGPLELRLFPFEVDGFVPDTSAAVVEGYREALMAVYPVTDVQITVADVEVWTSPFDLGDINVQVGMLQEEAMWAGELEWDVYAYGMVTGVATRDEFEGSTGTSEDGGGGSLNRAYFATGAAFGDQKSEDTLIHEIGHTHALPHAPCDGEPDADADYPYSGGTIGVEGYDRRTGTFLAADESFDMMSYCFPRWISDYNYAKLAEHVANAQGYSGFE